MATLRDSTASSPSPKLRRWRSRALRFATLVGAAFIIGFLLEARYGLKSEAPASAFQAAMEKTLPDFSRAVAIVSPDRGGAATDFRQMLAAISASGMRRLDDDEIRQLVTLRSNLAAHADIDACAAMWSGGTSDLVSAVAKLPEDEQLAWAHLFDTAALKIIAGVPERPAPGKTDYQQAFNRTLAGIAPAQFAVVERAVARDSHPPIDTECAATRVFYGRLARMNDADAVTVTRASFYR